MTITFNGIGTQFYGKDHVIQVSMLCEHCGHVTLHESYDTTKYFVVLFVPLFPLKKLRILEHCRHCNRWREVKLKTWTESKETATREVLAKMTHDPSDGEAIKQAIATATQFQDEGILMKFKDLVAARSDDREVQVLFASALSYFGNHHDAIEPLEKALSLNDDRDVREQLALELIQVGRPADAEKLIDYVWKETSPEYQNWLSRLLTVISLFRIMRRLPIGSTD